MYTRESNTIDRFVIRSSGFQKHEVRFGMNSKNLESGDVFGMKSVRQALKWYHNVEKLGGHPLAETEMVGERHRETGRPFTITRLGKTVQILLRAAIDELRPNDNAPNSDDEKWSPYLILKGQFIDGHSVRQIYLTHSAISNRTKYFRVQKMAIKRLAEVLREWEDLQVDSQIIPQSSTFIAPTRNDRELVGRQGILADLKDRLLGAGGVAYSLSGLPGVGKTA